MSIRGLLTRVSRIETQRSPRPSLIEVWYGTFAAFEARVQADITAGKRDKIEMPMVLAALRRWQLERGS
jgi:hypothetical protein